EGEEDATARVTPLSRGKDPLDDVFGSDADTWSDIRKSRSRNSKRTTNPNVVNLALTPSDLAEMPYPGELEEEGQISVAGNEEDEVNHILEKMEHPQLSNS